MMVSRTDLKIITTPTCLTVLALWWWWWCEGLPLLGTKCLTLWWWWWCEGLPLLAPKCFHSNSKNKTYTYSNVIKFHPRAFYIFCENLLFTWWSLLHEKSVFSWYFNNLINPFLADFSILSPENKGYKMEILGRNGLLLI